MYLIAKIDNSKYSIPSFNENIKFEHNKVFKLPNNMGNLIP